MWPCRFELTERLRYRVGASAKAAPSGVTLSLSLSLTLTLPLPLTLTRRVLCPARRGVPPLVRLDALYSTLEGLRTLTPNGPPSLRTCRSLRVQAAWLGLGSGLGSPNLTLT